MSKSLRGISGLAAALLLGLAVAPVLFPTPARAWEPVATASADDFAAFNRRVSADLYPYPGHGAAPLGFHGFELWAESTYDHGAGDQGAVRATIDGNFPGGVLAAGRVGVRKGLPGGVDVGVSYGEALGSSVRLAAVELQLALLGGGVTEPAVGLRLTGSRTVGSRVYDLQQVGVELLVSKGFPLVTPYLGGGFVESRGKLGRGPSQLADNTTRAVAFAGLRLHLLFPAITVEVEKAEVVQGAVRVSFGF